MNTDTESLRSFFNEAADLAGKIALKHFRGELVVDTKKDKSPVTAADREIEEVLRELIIRKYPGHGIIGEEFGKVNSDAEWLWIIDPIDGTRAFMTGKPLFGSVIGLWRAGIPIAGLIDQPFTKERWFGVAGHFSFHNGTPIKVAHPRSLDQVRLFTGEPHMFSDAHFEIYLKLCRSVKSPQYACDCYAYGLLAMGWADLVLERKLKIYDIAGIVPIIMGAGGFIGDWNLNPISLNFDGHVVAASSKGLAESALKLFAEPQSELNRTSPKTLNEIQKPSVP